MEWAGEAERVGGRGVRGGISEQGGSDFLDSTGPGLSDQTRNPTPQGFALRRPQTVGLV